VSNITERDEPGLLTAGLRYGGQSRRRWWPRLRRRREQPSAQWALQYVGGQWALRLLSSTPGDLELPLAYINRTLPASDPEAAYGWALSVLPLDVQHTVTQA
jgi:hypothetical protein